MYALMAKRKTNENLGYVPRELTLEEEHKYSEEA
jgi:hypothetical protein